MIVVTTPPLPPSTLLVPGKTLLFLPSLVKAVGINEAVVLQQLRYRLADERAPRVWEGRRWARASVRTWQERDFPFWSDKTIQRTFDSLERRGLVHSAQPDLARRDGTKWYTINFAALEPLAKLIAGRGAGRDAATSIDTPDGNGLPPLPTNTLLLAEPPLVILVDLAVRVGLDEALVLQQLRYWLADERKPPIRDGQRWVCPREIDFFGPITHRSPAVLEKLLRRLELAGLVRASARYNAMPGDRTKWYTLDFEAIERIAAEALENPIVGQADDLTKSKAMKCPVPITHVDQLQPAPLTNAKSTEGPTPSRPSDQDQADKVADSLKGSKTDWQNEYQVQQQYEDKDVVVIGLEQALCERGITRTVARRLGVTITATTIARQIEIYDWLREQYTEPSQVTPGRLRRMIEEDWQPPRGYRPVRAREREELARNADEAARASRAAAAAHAIRALHAERDAIIEELGLDSEDQRRWSGVVAASPVLPAPFREAFFYAPAPGSAEPAVIIFADGASKDRALGTTHRATRATIAARLAGLYRYPSLQIRYMDVAELRDAMRRPDGERDVPPATTPRRSSPPTAKRLAGQRTPGTTR